MAENENRALIPETANAPQSGTNGKEKKFFTKDVWMCIVVLAAIAVVAGVLLGLVNWLTYVDPDQAIREQLAGYYGVSAEEVRAFGEGVTEGGSYVSAAYIVDSEEGETYVFHAVGNGSKGGTLELLVHIAADGRIADIEVYSQSETAGYTDRVVKANKGKYVGKNAVEIGQFVLVKDESAVKDESYVDAVSQATMTSRGFNNAVNAALASFNANVAEVEA